MNAFISLIMITVSVVGFFVYINPSYKGIKVIRSDLSEYQAALDNAANIKRVREQKIAERNSISKAELERLQKLLPDHVDNIRLVIDMDGIASRYDTTVEDIRIETESDKKAASQGLTDSQHKSLVLRFKIALPYQQLKPFLSDLERSLRLVDPVSLSFRAADKGDNIYDIALRTYWLP